MATENNHRIYNTCLVECGLSEGCPSERWSIEGGDVTLVALSKDTDLVVVVGAPTA